MDPDKAADELIAKLYAEAARAAGKDLEREDEILIELLERELRERLRVNVGLINENAHLKEKP